MAFSTEILNLKFWQTSKFWEYQICQQTVHKITKFYSHFQVKSKRLSTSNEFNMQLVQRSQKNS